MRAFAAVPSSLSLNRLVGRLLNAEEVHLTGTGTMQEQFKHYLAEQAQFKKTVVTESTSNAMSDQKLVALVSGHFN